MIQSCRDPSAAGTRLRDGWSFGTTTSQVSQRTVYLHPRQCRFLILLDEVMVGVFGVYQRAEVERVDGGQVE